MHGEIYTSEAFLKAHQDLQNSPPEPNCTLLCRVPSAKLCAHAAYFQTLPDNFNDFVLEQAGHYSPSAAFYVHCRREFFHAQWLKLLDNEFIKAYQHGIMLMCADSVARHLYPCLLTYSADYPEKVLITNIHNLGGCPCPQCLIQKDHIENVASEEDMLQQQSLACNNNMEHSDNYVVNFVPVEKLLKPEAMVPTEMQNAFSVHLSHLGFDHFIMLAIDLLHEFKLEVWKSHFIHLLQILDSHKGHLLKVLDFWRVAYSLNAMGAVSNVWEYSAQYWYSWNFFPNLIMTRS
ncbi:hypothetical protein OG21DRAFT_1477113 [Imleria badia]|nr:hypothetical protein OG21DRAFT_1477113 [Imleria badia]